MGASSLILVRTHDCRGCPDFGGARGPDRGSAWLRGSDARLRIVVSDRAGADLTHAPGVRFLRASTRALPGSVRRRSSRRTGEGEATVTVRAAGDDIARVRVIVSEIDDRRTVGFTNRGHSDPDQAGLHHWGLSRRQIQWSRNGFRLSLLRVPDPAFDHESSGARLAGAGRVFPPRAAVRA